MSGKIEKIYEQEFVNKSIFQYVIIDKKITYTFSEEEIFLSKEEAEKASKEQFTKYSSGKNKERKQKRESLKGKIANLKEKLKQVENCEFVPGESVTVIKPGDQIFIICLDLEPEQEVEIYDYTVETITKVITKKGVEITSVKTDGDAVSMPCYFYLNKLNKLNQSEEEFYYMTFSSREFAEANLNFAKKLILEDAIKEFESRL